MASIQGFVVNTACANHRQIFTQEDQRVLFKNNNFWLFIDFDTSSGDQGVSVRELEMFKILKINIHLSFSSS